MRLFSGFTRSLFLVALAIFAVLVVVSFITGAVGLGQVYIYYWIFIAGILLGRGANLGDKESSGPKSLPGFRGGLSLIYASGGGMLGLVCKLIPPSLDSNHPHRPNRRDRCLRSPSSSSTCTKRYATGLIARVVKRVGPSTYSIYLFHIYFLTLFAVLGASVSPGAAPILVVALGIPCAIIVPAATSKPWSTVP